MQIFVKKQNGQQFCIDVGMKDTLLDIKHKIHALEHVPADRQKIVFAGHNLENERLFNDYGIQKNSTVYLEIADQN